MKSKFTHAIMLLSAIAAFLPVLGVDYLLDSYVRVRERAQLQMTVDSVTERIQATAQDAITSLRSILASSPSLCTPTFIANVHKQMESSLYLKQVLVENADGVQYCDAFGKQVSYSALSDTLSIPGHSETLTVVELADMKNPVLKVTQNFGGQRKVSAFVPVISNPPESLLRGLKPTAMVRISLTNGTSVLAAGDPTAFENRGSTEFVSAQSIAGEIPIKAESAVPFAVVRADYADLDASFTIVACLMSGGFLVLALQYVRRSSLPAFDLERAIQAGEIKPWYQPVINLRTGALAGCEVLCRWEKKNGQVVLPGSFIDYAEVTGLAIPMTLSLMQQVRNDLADICRDMPDIKVSINLFEGHFRDSSIVEDVQAIFADSPISFRQLVFEITERRPLENVPQTTAVISGLHALGSRLAMDDAGTGHSNLAYMQTLGVDVIKIDRVFVDMIKAGTTQVPVLDGLISMAHDLGTEIVAEGVETEAQALYLRARGVVMAQGYLFAPAIKVTAFRDLARALNGKQPAAAAPTRPSVAA
ncbi:EAL domain-containing protein [Devosia sp.]|uniref:EAL domain-containing protein n=1 Tax=Devosia sp. TaxID=1871048 RepID=UPI0037BE9056